VGDQLAKQLAGSHRSIEHADTQSTPGACSSQDAGPQPVPPQGEVTVAPPPGFVGPAVQANFRLLPKCASPHSMHDRQRSALLKPPEWYTQDPRWQQHHTTQQAKHRCGEASADCHTLEG
jgi:hypothetical protein